MPPPDVDLAFATPGCGVEDMMGREKGEVDASSGVADAVGSPTLERKKNVPVRDDQDPQEEHDQRSLLSEKNSIDIVPPQHAPTMSRIETVELRRQNGRQLG